MRRDDCSNQSYAESLSVLLAGITLTFGSSLLEHERYGGSYLGLGRLDTLGK